MRGKRFFGYKDTLMSLNRLRKKIVRYALLIFIVWAFYQIFWARYFYIVTAYCNCPICVNVPEYLDNQFASGKKIYWGGAAADPKVPFGARIELVPQSPKDIWDVLTLLRGRFKYRVEDRGGKIQGRHIDLYIPKSLGGHKKALKWGKKRMRIKINGELAK